jgi:tRNA(Ile)-lysidine synthase
VTPAQLKTLLLDNNLVTKGDGVIVACSGGPDSTALLSLLAACDLPLRLIAVYIDHSLRPDESKEEKTLLHNLAAALQIDCQIITVDVPGHKRQEKTSLEESCRVLRYRALEKCRVDCGAEVIAVAHTADDQAEELLLRLFRGTGLKGLAGMALKNKRIIRPLLSCSKETLLQYLHNSAIPYCIDSSNSDRSFLRNRLRLEILPLLKTHFNPSLRPTLLRTADILRQDNDLLETITEAAYKEAVVSQRGNIGTEKSVTIALDAFLPLHPAVKRRIVEKLCWEFGTPPDFDHIEKICSLAEQGRTGSELHLPRGLRLYKNTTGLDFLRMEGVEKFRGRIPDPVLPATTIAGPGSLSIDALDARLNITSLPRAPAELPDKSLLLDADTISFPILLRSFRPGERFTPQGMQGSKKVARFLADCRIARNQRSTYPVLVSSKNEIIAVLGLRVDSKFAVTPLTTQFLLVSWMVSRHTNR